MQDLMYRHKYKHVCKSTDRDKYRDIKNYLKVANFPISVLFEI